MQRKLQVAVAGGGPAGLGVAIGLAQLGHDVHVIEELLSPEVRGTVDRDCCYPIVLEARGMKALEYLGMLEDNSPVRQHTVQFLSLPFDSLVGSRDDLVLGMLKHIEWRQSTWSGKVHTHFGVSITDVDLIGHFVSVEVHNIGLDSAEDLMKMKFDVICACDGQWSRVRDSAASQDPELIVTKFEAECKRYYKSINLDKLDAQGAFGSLQPGHMYNFPWGVRCTCVANGSAIGMVPMHMLGTEDKPCQLRQLGLEGLLPYVTKEEELAFDSRPLFVEESSVCVSRLVAGGCVILVGDAATSPLIGGKVHSRQGVNHALDMAVHLVDTFKSMPGMEVAEILRACSEDRMLDEDAYAEGHFGFPQSTERYRILEENGDSHFFAQRSDKGENDKTDWWDNKHSWRGDGKGKGGRWKSV